MSRTLLTASVLVALLVASRLLTAQAAPGSGHWEGSFNGPNGEVSVQLDLSVNASGSLVGTLGTDEVKGLPLARLAVEGRTVRFEIPSAGARFSGTLADDGRSLTGEFVNAAGAAPSVLTRTGDARIAAPIASAAIARELEGTWNGILEVEGRKKRLVLQMRNQPDGTSIGTIVSVDDGEIELPVALTQQGRDLIVEITVNGGRFAATMNDAATELSGTYTERTVQLPLKFRR
jgi:hypothetical protein